MKLAWIEVHQTLPNHRKTIEAAAILDISPVQMIGHLICLWLWALDNAPDGVMYTSRNALRNKMVANVSQWDGDPDAFVDALVESGFLNEIDDALELHDWYDYAGKLMETRKANRERQRRYREAKKQKEKKAKSDDDVTRDVTVTKIERHAPTVPNRTVPNSTNNKEYTCAPDGARAYTAPSPGGSVEAEKVTATPDGDKLSEKSRPRSPFKSKRQEQLFDEFWERYPKKRSKGQAERAWVKLKPDEQLFEAIMTGLKRAKTSVDWAKNGGQYIPYPSTWLNAKGWEDEHDERGIGNDRHGSKSKFDELVIRDDDI